VAGEQVLDAPAHGVIPFDFQCFDQDGLLARGVASVESAAPGRQSRAATYA
jgi:hypothetical protein